MGGYGHFVRFAVVSSASAASPSSKEAAGFRHFGSVRRQRDWDQWSSSIPVCLLPAFFSARIGSNPVQLILGRLPHSRRGREGLTAGHLLIRVSSAGQFRDSGLSHPKGPEAELPTLLDRLAVWPVPRSEIWIPRAPRATKTQTRRIVGLRKACGDRRPERPEVSDVPNHLKRRRFALHR